MIVKTPILKSKTLSDLNNCNVWLKMESMQPSGSFKQRSIGNACSCYAEKGAKKFISSSGGNAGISVAYMGNSLGIPVIIVVPETTSQKAIDMMRQQDAEIIVHGKIWSEANDLALQLVNSEAIYIHPFDDQYLWDGVAKIIDETIEDGIVPSAVVLSVGGGSLLSGISQGLSKYNLNIPIYAVETEGTASLNTAIKMEQHIKLDKVTGVATTLATQQVCKKAFELTQSKDIKGLTVTDQEAVNACFKFLDNHRILVEPACGATLATLYNKKIDFLDSDNVLVIVCGGASISLEQLLRYSDQ